MRFGKIIIVLLFIIPVTAFAQEKDITGLWKGTSYSDTTQRYYQYEIGISKEKGKYTGFSHVWYLVGDTQYFAVKKIAVRIAKDGKIVTEDDGIIAHNFPIPPNKGIRQLNIMDLNASDSIMTLKGPFVTNRTRDYHQLTGSVSLQRKNDFWQSSLVPHLQELGKDEELSFVKEEKQLLAKADEAERELQLSQKNIAVKEEKQQVEKDKLSLAESKKAEAEKEKIAKLEADKKLQQEKETARLETAKEKEAKRIAEEKEKADKILAKQELAKQTETEKETAKLETAKEKEAKRIAAEKEKADKILAKQELAKQTEAEKESARLLALKEKQDKIAEQEKEKADKLLAKQEADKKTAEEKLKQRDDIAKEKSIKKEADKKPVNTPVTFKTSTEPAADVDSRKTIVQQTVSFSSDSLQLSLYDNGEIDGDTVSVLMNGKLILAKQGLGVRAIKHTIYIPRDVDKIEMVMYAETLGSIPPNTGLLVIRDGKDMYEIRFSGDLKKNAAIVFNRKKE